MTETDRDRHAPLDPARDRQAEKAELAAQRRKLDNFIEAIGERHDSEALAKALADTERRVEILQDEVQSLHGSPRTGLQSTAC